MSTPHRPPVEARVYVPAPGETCDVELMPAGDVTEGVVRVGGTIRRPHQPQSLAVAAYLDWLEDAGFDGSPRFLGRDTQGKDVLTFLPGACAGAEPEFSPVRALVLRAARLGLPSVDQPLLSLNRTPTCSS